MRKWALWGVKFALKGVEKRISARWRSSFSGMSSSWQVKMLCPFAEILQNSCTNWVSSALSRKWLYSTFCHLFCVELVEDLATSEWHIFLPSPKLIWENVHSRRKTLCSCCCRSVAQSCLTLCDGLQHARLNCPSPFPGACSNSCLLTQWCHPTSVSPFFSCLQSFPASGSFPTSRLLASGGQSIGASASVLPMNIQSWFPLRWTSLISLQSMGLSRVFSNTTIQKHQFFNDQLS